MRDVRQPMGAPGCPEFAFSMASAANMRTVVVISRRVSDEAVIRGPYSSLRRAVCPARPQGSTEKSTEVHLNLNQAPYRALFPADVSA